MTDVDADDVRVIGAEATTRVEQSERGIRVVATAESTLSRLVMGSPRT